MWKDTGFIVHNKNDCKVNYMKNDIKELREENDLLRRELKTAREAADITAKLVVKQFEKTEQMLHRFQSANAQRQAVLNAATQLSIIATDLEGAITLFNRGAVNLLGFSESEMVGKRNISCIHLKEELKKYANEITGFTFDDYRAIKVFTLHVKQQISKTSEWTYVRKNGTHLPVNLSITPFYNAKGILNGYLFTAMDMTEHKTMETKLISAMENAEAANNSKGDFLARMSHEIRTPMNGILGMAHLMEKTQLSDKQYNYLNKIIASANILLNLINDILDFSKIEAGKLTLEYIDFDLNEVLDTLTGTIGLQAEKKGLEFLFNIDRDVPLKLTGDPLRLGQVLINLAGNAIKFTEKGEIVISVTLDHHEEKRLQGTGEVELKFSVKDSGIGLNKEQINDLFKAFTQADDTITRKYGGTGLGLSICRQLTEMMKGKIWVESSPGQGSTFFFTAKLKPSKMEDESRVSESCAAILKGRRVLVVDDNKTARELLASILDSFHMAVDDAPDGKTAIKLLESALENKTPYDVVLLDWIMPGMDGIETARLIKANNAMTDIPAMLMVTATGREDARIKAEEAGIDALLLKPVYPSVIYNTLLQILCIEDRSKKTGNTKKAHVKTQGVMNNIEGACILLVEDNAINQEIAVEFLRDAGMVVVVANNGQECLDLTEKNQFDIVLMDIQMPVMDGLETTRILRNERKLKVPIIAMTAHAMAGDREKSLDAGMNDHLNKPVDPNALYEILQKFIPEKQSLTETVHAVTSGTGISPANSAASYATNAIATGKNKTDTKKEVMPVVSKIKNEFSTSDKNLPYVKGINLTNALKRMNNKPELLFSLIKNFKKEYADLPFAVKKLFHEKAFEQIKIYAHNIKGLSAYLGAESLVEASLSLENHMKALAEQEDDLISSDYCRKPDHCSKIDDEPILSFIDELKKLLTILDQLPSDSEKDLFDENKKDQNDFPLDKTSDILYLSEKEKRILQDFMIILGKGELGALDLLPDIEQVLTKCGRKAELKIILEMMEDIEYEEAAKIIEELLKNCSEIYL